MTGGEVPPVVTDTGEGEAGLRRTIWGLQLCPAGDDLEIDEAMSVLTFISGKGSPMRDGYLLVRPEELVRAVERASAAADDLVARYDEMIRARAAAPVPAVPAEAECWTPNCAETRYHPGPCLPRLPAPLAETREAAAAVVLDGSRLRADSMMLNASVAAMKGHTAGCTCLACDALAAEVAADLLAALPSGEPGATLLHRLHQAQAVRDPSLLRSIEPEPYSGPGDFWTQAEWAEWSNDLTLPMPEEYDGDEAQESIIARFVEDAGKVYATDPDSWWTVVRGETP